MRGVRRGEKETKLTSHSVMRRRKEGTDPIYWSARDCVCCGWIVWVQAHRSQTPSQTCPRRAASSRARLCEREARSRGQFPSTGTIDVRDFQLPLLSLRRARDCGQNVAREAEGKKGRRSDASSSLSSFPPRLSLSRLRTALLVFVEGLVIFSLCSWSYSENLPSEAVR